MALGPAQAQDNTEATISSLRDRLDSKSTQIAALKTQVAELKTQVADLKRQLPTPTPAVVSYSGSGNGVQSVRLTAGLHIVKLQVSSGVLQLNVYDQNGRAIVSSIIIGPDQLEGSSTLRVDVTGDYVLDIKSRSDWTVSVE